MGYDKSAFREMPLQPGQRVVRFKARRTIGGAANNRRQVSMMYYEGLNKDDEVVCRTLEPPKIYGDPNTPLPRAFNQEVRQHTQVKFICDECIVGLTFRAYLINLATEKKVYSPNGIRLETIWGRLTEDERDFIEKAWLRKMGLSKYGERKDGKPISHDEED